MVYDTYYDTSLRDYWWNAAMNNARGTSPSAKGRNVYLTDDVWFNSERKDAILKALPDATLVHYDGTPLKDGDMMVKLLNGSDQVSEVYSLAVTKHGVPDEKLDKSLVVTLVPSSVKDFTPPAPGSPLPQETVPSKTNLGNHDRKAGLSASIMTVSFTLSGGSLALFKGLVDSFKDLVDDVLLQFSEDGLQVRAMDACHVALLDLYWPSDLCDAYSVSSTVDLALSMTYMAKVLKCSKSKDDIFVFEYSNQHSVSMAFGTARKPKTSSFTVKLMEEPEDSVQVPGDVHFDHQYSCSSKLLDAAIKSMGQFSETCSVSTAEDHLVIKSAEACLQVPLETVPDWDAPAANFSVKYLSTFSKCRGLSKT
ncbi:hypothetical protein GGF32_007004, partial [Allomyces javanicus]